LLSVARRSKPERAGPDRRNTRRAKARAKARATLAAGFSRKRSQQSRDEDQPWKLGLVLCTKCTLLPAIPTLPAGSKSSERKKSEKERTENRESGPHTRTHTRTHSHAHSLPLSHLIDSSPLWPSHPPAHAQPFGLPGLVSPAKSSPIQSTQLFL